MTGQDFWQGLYVRLFLPEWVITVYADERDECKQYNNFIPVIDRALFSTAMDGGCYNAAMNEISTSADENFF
jgi:hypothetical protein